MLGTIYEGRGDELPVSAFPCDGTFPTGTAKWEKRNLALEIPVWDTNTCIQCGKCAMVCPHAVIRIKVYDSQRTRSSRRRPSSPREARDKEWAGMKYTIQVAPEDCTGCGICVDICPAKNKSETRLKALNMAPQPPLRVPERDNWDFFLNIPELDRRKIKVNHYPPATGPGAAVRILRRLLGLRRNALSQAALATFRRSRAYRQCHRLLFDLRRQPAHHTVDEELPTAVVPRGRIPCSKTMQNSDLGFRLSIDKQTEFARELVLLLAPRSATNSQPRFSRAAER